MRIQDLLENENIPHLYLDMDGVQADFFTQWARWYSKKTGNPDVQRYKDIGDKQAREQSIEMLNKEGPEFIEQFFATLPELPGFSTLLEWLKTNNIPFTILSAPLRGNHEASIAGKIAWLDEHNPGTSANAIFTGMKEKYATKGGQNVLVDDHKKYIASWEAKGGIGVLHRDNNVQGTISALEKIYFGDEEPEGELDLNEKTSPDVCRSPKRLGRSDHSSCVSQGLRPHQSKGKGHTDGHGNYLKGKKAKSVKYGGSVKDYDGK